MKITYLIGILSGIILITGSCGTTDSGDDGGGQTETPTYSLSTGLSPQGAGTVSPSSGTFDENTQVSVEATPGDGWVFNGWTGDIESDDNPLTFNIVQNTSLTANFTDISSDYVVDLTASNGGNDILLQYGQQIEISTVEALPIPPEGAFHVWFKRDGEELFTDIVSNSQTEVSWRLNLQPGDEDTVVLEWVLDIDTADGTLVLTDETDSFSLDMFTETTYQVNAAQIDVLIIEYTLERE